MRRLIRPITRTGVLLAFAAAGVTITGYSTNGKWGTKVVDFYVNPRNADVGESAAAAALQVGANAWTGQSKANFDFVYAGQVTDTSTAYDGRNVVIFRNSTNGSAIASTYTWSSGGVLVDSDTVFWDGGYKFFTGSSGCVGPNAAYIEDIATHEFGHALGMGHSSVSGATMTPGYSTCSQTQRTLAADDIAGVEKLYPATSSTNQPPSVSITSPRSILTFSSGSSISFTGSASDPEQGNLTSAMTWTSNLSGAIGTGGSFSRTLPVGIHNVTASVRDSAGVTRGTAVTLTITLLSAPTSPTTPTLTARAYRVNTTKKVDLAWTGLTSTYVDIFRDGVKIIKVSNTGSRTDVLSGTGSSSYAYKVCAAGTLTCTKKAVAAF